MFKILRREYVNATLKMNGIQVFSNNKFKNLFLILESTNQNTLATKSKELDAMQGELNTIVNANKDLHIAIDGLKQEISELSEKPVHSNNAIISNDNELADMQQRVENNTKELQEKCERILHLETEHEEFQQIFNAEKGFLSFSAMLLFCY